MGIHHVKSLDLHAKWPCGEKDLISDVPGVLVGHTTLTDPAKDIHTGVTAVLPHGGNLFRDKVMAACAVINDMATFDQAGIDDGYLDEIREGDKFTVEAPK